MDAFVSFLGLCLLELSQRGSVSTNSEAKAQKLRTDAIPVQTVTYSSNDTVDTDAPLLSGTGDRQNRTQNLTPCCSSGFTRAKIPRSFFAFA